MGKRDEEEGAQQQERRGGGAIEQKARREAKKTRGKGGRGEAGKSKQKGWGGGQGKGRCAEICCTGGLQVALLFVPLGFLERKAGLQLLLPQKVSIGGRGKAAIQKSCKCFASEPREEPASSFPFRSLPLFFPFLAFAPCTFPSERRRVREVKVQQKDKPRRSRHCRDHVRV